MKKCLLSVLIIVFMGLPFLGAVTAYAGHVSFAQARQVEDSGAVDAGAGTELNDWINNTINVLSALVGLVIVGSIIIAGIQYQTARDNASQVSAAKNRIAMAVLSLFLYFFAYALLQWLIPGGVFYG